MSASVWRHLKIAGRSHFRELQHNPFRSQQIETQSFHIR